MKVALERNHLLKSLGHVHRVVERRTTHPILSNVLVKAADGALLLRTTDLDIEVTESVPAMTATPGMTTVPAHTLYEIVRKLADGAEVNLEVDGSREQMTITSGRSRFNLACISADGFPDFQTGDFSHGFALNTGTVKQLIDSTQFAISSEETRYYLNGIFFHTIDGMDDTILRAVATDGHRLARTQMVAPEGVRGMPSIIVPRKTVVEMQKLLSPGDSDVTIEVSETKIRFEVDGVVLLSKLIEGSFPDYEQVIPQHNDKELRVNTAHFKQAVDRVSTIASDRGGKAVKLGLSDGLLELSVTNPDHGTAREELPVMFGHDGFEIGFNARYLLDIIDQITSDEVIFTLSDAGSPAVVQSQDDSDTLYVLMPMRV